MPNEREGGHGTLGGRRGATNPLTAALEEEEKEELCVWEKEEKEEGVRGHAQASPQEKG